MADSKWKGVERLAAGISSGLDSGHREPTAEEKFAYLSMKLMERLEPLLEAADRVTAMRCSVPVDDWHLIDSLRREVAKWR